MSESKRRLDSSLEKLFPDLQKTGYEVTSNKTPNYNCVAWAAEYDQTRWWEPLNEPGCYWPRNVPFDYSISSYIKVFTSLGYSLCDDSSLESTFEKVALYENKNGFTHVSRQLPDGAWTSKLGPQEDIRHEHVGGLQSFSYGKPAHFLKRSISSPSAR